MITRKAKRVYTPLLAIATMMLLVACGNKTIGKATTTTAAPKEIVTLEALILPANNSGLIDGWLGEFLQIKVGVKIDMIAPGSHGEQKLQAYLASGELPDLIGFNDFKQVTDAIAGDLLINLDKHQDKLPNVVANAPMALKYARDKLSNGTGGVYAALTGIGPAEQFKDANYGPLMRWDLYKKLNSPKLKTLNDYVSLMKKMVDLEPKNKDGQKTYGITLWKDWDVNFMNQAIEPGRLMGIDAGIGGTELVEYDYNTKKMTSILDNNSSYISSLKFYNAAYKMGVLDPDSITQTFDSARAKYASGRVMMGWPMWLGSGFNTDENKAAGIGFMPVAFEGEKSVIETTSSIGKNWSVGIGAKTKKLDACLALIDALYNIDYVMTMRNGGPQGILWEVGKDNLPYITNQGWDILNNDKELPGGGKSWNDFFNILGVTGGVINPKFNVPINFNAWPASKGNKTSALEQDWQKAIGYKTQMDQLLAQNMYTYYPAWKDALVPTSDEISNIAAQIGAVVKPNSWAMVYARDKSEFDKLLKEMQDKAKTIGIDKVLAYDTKVIKDAQNLMPNYEK